MSIRGIILAGGSGTRLSPVTVGINKHFLAVYDKPMFYYPLSTLMLAGVRDIAIISDKKSLENFVNHFGDGTALGIRLNYFVQKSPRGIPEAFQICESFIKDCISVLILGDNIFVGAGMGGQIRRDLNNFEQGINFRKVNAAGSMIFSYQTSKWRNYGVVEFDKKNKPIKLVEKPTNFISDFVIPGLYFFNQEVTTFVKKLKPSARGELEIIDLLNIYMKKNLLQVKKLPRGSGWVDGGNPEDLFAASEMVRLLQNRSGSIISAPEEIALHNGWIKTENVLRGTWQGGKFSYKKFSN